MADLLGTLGADLGNLYLHNAGVPVTLSDTGQAVSLTSFPAGGKQPVTALTGGAPVSSAALASGPAFTSPVAKDVKGLGRWALAFVVFLGVLLFLKPGEAAILSVTIILGALFVNAQDAASKGQPTIIQKVLGGS